MKKMLGIAAVAACVAALAGDATAAEELTEAQEKTVQDCLHALFRIPKAEFIVMGLRNLLQMNRGVVKSIFLQLDDENCLRFLHANWYALGMDEVMMQ